MKKKCLECEAEIYGRADKRFCSSDCRATYYNRSHQETTNFMRNVNNILRKNRKILQGFNPDGKGRIHKDKLSAEGFKFGYFTNVYTTKSGKTYYFCYEQGYLPIENDWYALVVRQEYVD
jgi:hypothetical protein